MYYFGDRFCINRGRYDALFVERIPMQVLNQSLIPFYINTDRMLDLCAIENGGYSEYIDITQSSSNDTTKKKSGSMEAGIKFFERVYFAFRGELSKEQEETQAEERKMRMVQTAASILSNYLKSGNIVNIADEAIEAETTEKVEHENDFRKERELCKVENGELVCLCGCKILPEYKANNNGLITRSARFNIFLRANQKKLEKLYKRLNGVPDRAPIELLANISDNSEHHACHPVRLPALLSRNYFYQCELNDLWDVEMNCLCKLISYGEGRKAEIIALFC